MKMQSKTKKMIGVPVVAKGASATKRKVGIIQMKKSEKTLGKKQGMKYLY